MALPDKDPDEGGFVSPILIGVVAGLFLIIALMAAYMLGTAW